MDLERVLANHRDWLADASTGRCAYLSGAYLSGADFRSADLRVIDFTGANLRDAKFQFANLKDAYLPTADLRGAYLYGANLKGAFLKGADLNYADIRNVTGNNREVKSFQFSEWTTVMCFSAKIMAIGYEQHSFSEWAEFGDEIIADMDLNTLEFWNEYKDIIFKIIDKGVKEYG